MFKSIAILAGAILIAAPLLTGCSYNVSKFGANSEDVEQLKTLSAKINFGKITAKNPGQTSIGCRASGPVTLGGQPFETYIQEAIITELKLADKYDKNAKITLTGHLEKIDFSSSLGTANWVIRLKLSSSNSNSIVINSNYEFSGSFIGAQACSEMAQAFSPAVQHLINDIINHPKFKTLLKI